MVIDRSRTLSQEEPQSETEKDDCGSERETERETDAHSLPLSVALPAASSFRDCVCESQEMRRLLSLHDPPDKIPSGLQNVSYSPSQVFPDWILSSATWKNGSKSVENQNEISDILKIPVSKRQPEQVSTLIHWLMSVWGIANTMGFKRCNAMFKEFKYQIYEEGETVIKEGERGLTFYIIISGMTSVSKDGIGVVGQLGKGKSFGEIALTQGKDLRTATVTAMTRLEVLSLHKMDYDYFVRDIQESERRENFQILSACKLFQSWPKGRVDKICNTCLRKTYDAGSYIFRQGDPPDDLCVVVEGNVSIVKELVILCKNRWPVGMKKWRQLVTSNTKPILLKTLQRGDYFGEVAILKNTPRTTSAIAATRCVLISLDKNEFLHLITNNSSTAHIMEDQDGEMTRAIQKYVVDEDLVAAIGEIKGGPGSAAVLGGFSLSKRELEQHRRGLHSDHGDAPGSPTALKTPKNKSNKSPQKHSPSNTKGGTNTNNNTKNNRNNTQSSGLGNTSARREETNEGEERKKKETIRERISALTKQDQISEQLQRMVREKKIQEERVKEQAAAIAAGKVQKHRPQPHTQPHTHLLNSPETAMLVMAKSQSEGVLHGGVNANHKLPPAFGTGTGSESESRLRSKLHNLRNGTLLMKSTSINRRNQRYSLKGFDNDSGYNFDTNQTLIRRNSVISLSHFYDQVKDQLQSGEEGASGDPSDPNHSPVLRRTSLRQPSPVLLEAFRAKREKEKLERQLSAVKLHQTITEDEDDDEEDD